MNWLVATSLRLRVLVLAGSIVLMIYGVRAAQNAPLDVFPEFAPPLVEIQTEAPGLSTEEVESLIDRIHGWGKTTFIPNSGPWLISASQRLDETSRTSESKVLSDDFLEGLITFSDYLHGFFE